MRMGKKQSKSNQNWTNSQSQEIRNAPKLRIPRSLSRCSCVFVSAFFSTSFAHCLFLSRSLNLFYTKRFNAFTFSINTCFDVLRSNFDRKNVDEESFFHKKKI